MTHFGHKIGNEYKELFENAVEGIFHFTLDGHIFALNPAMARIFGYESPQDMIQSIDNFSTKIYVNPKDGESFLQEYGLWACYNVNSI